MAEKFNPYDYPCVNCKKPVRHSGCHDSCEGFKQATERKKAFERSMYLQKMKDYGYSTTGAVRSHACSMRKASRAYS